VSLIDVGRSAVINTVPLETSPQSRTLDLPLELAQTLYDSSVGTAKIMHLRDTNADGRPNEFGIFATESCSDRYGTVIGYSERQDRAVWYTFHLSVNDEGKVSSEDQHWIPVGFFDTPPKKGVWRFTWRYPEDPPREYRYEIRYDAAREQFSGVETIVRVP
jgi:hypothetical protein